MTTQQDDKDMMDMMMTDGNGFLEMRNPVYVPEMFGTTFGIPAGDYITLTTFDDDAVTELRQSIPFNQGKVTRKGRYNGRTFGKIFLGEAEQQGRRHYMLVAEGNTSEWLINWMSQESEAMRGFRRATMWKATRLDVQVSGLDDQLSFRDLKDDLSSDSMRWNRRGRKPEVTMNEGLKNKKGLGSTVYVGSRKTEDGYFVRIYEKPDDRGRRNIRFEVQLKGVSAHKAFTRLVSCSTMYSSIVKSVFDTFPKDVIDVHFGKLVPLLREGEEYRVRGEVNETDDIRRMSWYKYHVMPAMLEMQDVSALKWLRREMVGMLLFADERIKHLTIMESVNVANEKWNKIISDNDSARKAQAKATLALYEEECKSKEAHVKGQMPEQLELPLLDDLLEEVRWKYTRTEPKRHRLWEDNEDGTRTWF